MSLEDLPVLTGLTAFSPGHAVLHLADGSRVEVDTRQPGAWAAGGGEAVQLFGLESPFVLAVGLGDTATGYRVPAHLEGSVCAALNLYRPQEGPPRLTLTGLDRQPDAVTFQAVNQEGQSVSLTVPRPVFLQPSFPMPPLAEPVGLSVTHGDTPPSQTFHFEIHPETPEGRSVLELLGYAGRLDGLALN